MCSIVAAFVGVATTAVAQEIPSFSTIPNPAPSSTSAIEPGVLGIRTNYELVLTLGILASGLVFAMIVLYMSSRAFARSPETTSRLFTVVIMVTAALVLITAGYSNAQVAPVFGLFGTIVGYILGRRDQVVPDVEASKSAEHSPARSTQESVPDAKNGKVVR